MLNRIKRRYDDMRTIGALCLQAEKHALKDQQRKPGAEHFLLSALDLPDGTARRVFARVDTDPAGLPTAIARQYSDALRSLGVVPGLIEHATGSLPPLPAKKGVYDAAASGREVLRALAARRKEKGAAPLVGAEVVAVIASMAEGVAARALRAMGLELEVLKAAAEAELKAGGR